MADISTKPINALSIDVEDYWSIFSRDWLHAEAEPSDAVVRNTEWFLETLAEHNVKATFFVLGEVAARFPIIVKHIAENGHEVGVHGFYHRQVFKLTEEEFRREVGDCKKLLEDMISDYVIGHRAAAFSIMPETKWALEVLAEEGFRYDSSVFPIKGSRYGWPDFSKEICKIDLHSGRSIVEVPMSTITILGKTFPAAGGGYIRHFPYIVTKQAIRRIQKKRPAIVYIHPYEIDMEQFKFHIHHLPEEQRKRVLKFHRLQLRNRSTMKNKIVKLLRDFEFTTLNRIVELGLASS
jgi:polysaccharide deacetylase family protein (PEP-CTERM system associated)